VLRGSHQVHLIFSYYLNINGAERHQKRRFVTNLVTLAAAVAREAGGGGGLKVRFSGHNYFDYFWRMGLFTGRRIGTKLRARVLECVGRHEFLQRERLVYATYAGRVRRIRGAVIQFRRQRFFHRTFNPIVGAFMTGDFDPHLVAKAIALELQILRVFHKRFMRYARRLLWMCFHHWQPLSLLRGLRLEIRGRMTDHRRQVRRAQTKTTRYGTLKKSSLRVEAGHCRHLAYNRYGVISVSISYHLWPRDAERWEDRLAQSPLRAFGALGAAEEVADGCDAPLPPTLSLRHPTYDRDPTAVLDDWRRLEQLENQWRSGSLGTVEAAEWGAYPPLELLNRFGCYRFRQEFRRRRHLRRPYRKSLLLRPVSFTLGAATGLPHRAPLERALLAPFQLQLQRHQLLSLRLRSGHSRSRYSRLGPRVPPTLYQRWKPLQGTPAVEERRPVPRASFVPFHSPPDGDNLHTPWRQVRRRPSAQRNGPW
jgi:hypothetical protein